MAVKDVGTNWNRDTRNTIDENDKNLQRQINDLVLSSGDSNAEVVQARGGKPTLNDRLDSIEYEKASRTELSDGLAKKMTRGESISVGQIDKNSGKFDETYMSEEFLQQMAGDTPIHAVPADSSLNTAKYIDKSVIKDKVSFIERSTNLFNKYTLVREHNIDGDTGELIPNSPSRHTSQFIEVEAGHPYVFEKETPENVRYAFYDANFNFIISDLIPSGENDMTHILVIPENVRYLRVAVFTTQIETFKINKGNQPLPYEEPYERLSGSIKQPLDDADIRLFYYTQSLGGALSYVEQGEKKTDLTYDDEGNITKIVETGYGQTVTTEFVYDDKSNLVRVRKTKGDV